MARISQNICMIDEAGLSTQSTSYTPSDGSYGIAEYDPAWYDCKEAIYFECTFHISLGIALYATGYAQLYNKTDGSAVSGSEVSFYVSLGDTYGRVRSGDLSSVMTASKEYYVQIKISNANATVTLQNAQIVTYQNGEITLTATHWNLGDDMATTSTAYLEMSSPKRMLYTSGDYGGTVTTEFHSTIEIANGAQTASCQLIDTTVFPIQAALTTTSSTSPTLVKDITVSLIEGREYTVEIKSSERRTNARIRLAHLIFFQDGRGSPLTKTTSVKYVQVGRETGIATAYGTTQERRWGWNEDDWRYLTKTVDHEATIHGTSGATAYSRMYGANTTSDSEVSTASTSYSRQRATSITISGNTETIDPRHKTSNGANAYWVVGNRIIINITDMATPIKINIGDNWKAVGVIKQNVGDQWVSIKGQQTNISDAWKTIY